MDGLEFCEDHWYNHIVIRKKEDDALNLKRWLYLFFSTLMVGAVSSLILGLILERNLWGMGTLNIIVGLIGHIGAGLLFSLISQMGFFAYLAIHNFGLGLFRSLWSPVQVLLIAFTFFDLVYFRYQLFGEGASFFSFIWIPLGILVYSLIVSYFKVKQTNSRAAVPAVFLIFVVTVVEWIPALRENNLLSMFYMLIPLLLCNTWQVMQLHRLTQKKAPVKGA